MMKIGAFNNWMRGTTAAPRITPELKGALELVLKDIGNGRANKAKVKEDLLLPPPTISRQSRRNVAGSQVITDCSSSKTGNSDMASSSGSTIPSDRNGSETVGGSAGGASSKGDIPADEDMPLPLPPVDNVDRRTVMHEGHDNYEFMPLKLQEERERFDVFRVPRQLPEARRREILEHAERCLKDEAFAKALVTFADTPLAIMVLTEEEVLGEEIKPGDAAATVLDPRQILEENIDEDVLTFHGRYSLVLQPSVQYMPY
jgi:hypothetical protein